MNILEQLNFSSEKASTIVIKKTEKQQIFAVGLRKETILKEHKTSDPATLIVLKGEINFIINGESIHLKETDVFEIPVEVLHEVHGVLQENAFIIIKELH